MRLIIRTAVDARRKRGRLLNHRTGETLSEGGRGVFNRAHRIFRKEHAGSLARKIDPGPRAEIETLLIIQKLLRTHLAGDLHHIVVAGILERSFQIQISVIVLTLDRDSVECLSAVAGKSCFICDRPGVQRRSRSDRFKCGSRLKGIGNTVIAPDLVQCIQHLVVVHRADLLRRIEGRQIPGIVQVVPVR